MEKFQLNNGMSVVFAGHSKDYSVCLSVNIGHVNEPVSYTHLDVYKRQIKGWQNR